MLKIVATLAFLFLVHGKHHGGPLPSVLLVEKPEDKLSRLVVMPEVEGEGLQNINPVDCMDKKLYKDEDEVASIDSEAGYLCAFISFQVNQDTSRLAYQLYADKEESTLRYNLFKKCVDQINHINSQNLSYKTEVNFFCDRTANEKDQYLGYGRTSVLQVDAPDEGSEEGTEEGTEEASEEASEEAPEEASEDESDDDDVAGGAARSASNCDASDEGSDDDDDASRGKKQKTDDDDK